MVATKQSENSQSENDVGVWIDDRFYPDQLRAKKKSHSRIRERRVPAGGSRSDAVAKLHAKKPSPTEQVAIDLFESVWLSLPLAEKSASDFVESAQIVPYFVESYEQLVKYAGEGRALLEALCRYHVHSERDERVDSRQQREAEESKVRECMDVAMPRVLLGEELDVSTIAKRSDIAFTQLRDSLRRNATQLVESLFAALEQLVNKEVVGLIVWRTDSLCKFHFFRRLLIHVFEGQTTEERAQEYWRTVDGRRIIRTEETTQTTTTGRVMHELVRHEQQLMNASKLPLDSPDLYIPQDIRQVVKRVPEWLSPFVRVAVGDCFRERIIRHKEKDEKWEKKKERRRVYERPMVQFDPAITIGEFVLLGWGQKEQEREKQRRTAVDTLALAGILFLLGLALVVSVICGRPALLWYSWAAMAASLCPFNVAISRYVKSQGGRLMPSLFFAINASALLAGLTVVSGILAVLSRTWTPAVIAVFLLAALLSILLSTLQGLRYASAPSAKE